MRISHNKKTPPGQSRTAPVPLARLRSGGGEATGGRRALRSASGKSWAYTAVIKWSSHTTLNHERNAREPIQNNQMGRQRPRPREDQTASRNIATYIRSGLENSGRGRNHHSPFSCRSDNKRTHSGDCGQSAPEHRTSTRTCCRCCTPAIAKGWLSAERSTISFFGKYAAAPPQLARSCASIFLLFLPINKFTSPTIYGLLGFRAVGRRAKYVGAQFVACYRATRRMFDGSAILGWDTS